MFPTKYDEIIEQTGSIDPIAYGRTRNFIDGAVTKLSPYIARGVLSTRQILEKILSQGHNPFHIEKFIQELAWRDYWQQVWIAKGDQIDRDLKRAQPEVNNHEISTALVQGTTGIIAVDEAIATLYETGYLHNHMRMYVAALACNIGKSHWREPANWMYYHLLDGDWASNALSWQWVAGANSNKKYYANQENINKYTYSNQSGSFLDVPYEAFHKMEIPTVLNETIIPNLTTVLPLSEKLEIDPRIPTLIYNWYNLDPEWHSGERVNRVLLLEPSVFQAYPISEKSLKFMLELSKNIPSIQVYVGEFQDLKKEHYLQSIIYKEHPLNEYKGQEEPRDWMFSVKGHFPSFFVFWKKCRKELQ